MRPRLRAGVIFVVTLLTFWAGVARGVEESEPNSIVFDLEYNKDGQSLRVDIDQWRGRASFEKEPDFGGRYIIRGLIPAGVEEKDYIGYAWDEVEGKVYLDLNRNRDLTDDPNGVFSRGETGNRTLNLNQVRFTVKAGSFETPCVGDMYFYGRHYSYMNVRSGFSGVMEFNGKTWRCNIVDNIDGKIGGGDHFVLAPDGEQGSLFRIYESMSLRENIFFGGRAYKVDFEFKEKDDKPVLQMKLYELQVPLGKVKIESKFIKGLVVFNDTTLVVLDSPGGESAVPLGKFYYEQLVIVGDKSEKFKVTNFHGNNGFSVDADEAKMLKAGGPLINSVSVQRNGNVLTLGYKLVDPIGNEYGSLQGRRDNPPGFVVYKGDKQVGSGTFEYG